VCNVFGGEPRPLKGYGHVSKEVTSDQMKTNRWAAGKDERGELSLNQLS
jgi:hypothetical protein